MTEAFHLESKHLYPKSQTATRNPTVPPRRCLNTQGCVEVITVWGRHNFDLGRVCGWGPRARGREAGRGEDSKDGEYSFRIG